MTDRPDPSPPFDLDALAAWARSHLPDRAAQLDRDPEALRVALAELGDRHWLGLRVPARWGGRGVDALTYGRCCETLARDSGALMFLQVQHQSAVAQLATSRNRALQQRWLPAAVQPGGPRLGIGFSHLRRRDRPPVTAISVLGGYEISGQVPWVTGWGCFEAFVLGAPLPDGRVWFGVVPLAAMRDDRGGAIALGEPWPLAAMMSTQTVPVTLERWFVAEADTVAIEAADWVDRNDRRKALGSAFFALGSAQGAVDCLTALAPRQPEVGPTLESLTATLAACRTAVYACDAQAPLGDRLALRGRAIALALQATQIAVIAQGGSANLRDAPAQRLSREALVFATSGQTAAVRTATLAALQIKPLAD
jgi:alkylation response protein AidB-like acyl-CoA dehydrogenase